MIDFLKVVYAHFPFPWSYNKNFLWFIRPLIILLVWSTLYTPYFFIGIVYPKHLLWLFLFILQYVWPGMILLLVSVSSYLPTNNPDSRRSVESLPSPTPQSINSFIWIPLTVYPDWPRWMHHSPFVSEWNLLLLLQKTEIKIADLEFCTNSRISDCIIPSSHNRWKFVNDTYFLKQNKHNLRKMLKIKWQVQVQGNSMHTWFT